MNKNNMQSAEDLYNILLNINKFRLEFKPHIKKYYKCRDVHAEVLNSMMTYFTEDKYSLEDEINKIYPSLKQELGKDISNFVIDLCTDDRDDASILTEIAFYKNHKDMTSLTEEFIAKNKFRKEEKKKMLESMNNSYVGLFKVVGVDSENAYVTLEDVFTKKKFKIIDIAFTTLIKKPDNQYTYNRIITYDGITFGTGIHISFLKDNKELIKYIKNENNKYKSNLVRCIELYNIYKKSDLRVNTIHQ